IVAGRLTFDRLQAVSAAIPGPKMITGTIGCTREQASSSRDSNIGGESLRTSVLLVGPCSPVSCAQAIYRVYYSSGARAKRAPPRRARAEPRLEAWAHAAFRPAGARERRLRSACRARRAYPARA